MISQAPVAIKEFQKMGAEKVFDQNKVVLVPDHFTPNKDIKAAEQCKMLREFAVDQSIENYFEVGEMGIEHALLPEKGIVVAGDAVSSVQTPTPVPTAHWVLLPQGIGSTDMAAGMARGKAWFKVPSAIKFELTGKPTKWGKRQGCNSPHHRHDRCGWCTLQVHGIHGPRTEKPFYG